MSATVSAKVIFQSAMRLSTISIAATADRVAAATCSTPAAGSSRSACRTSATSASTFGCSRREGGELAAVLDPHVVEQHAKVGLVHAELLLDGRGGQPDLAAHDAPAGGRPMARIDGLDAIGAVRVVGRQAVAQRSDRALRIGRAQTLGEQFVVRQSLSSRAGGRSGRCA